MKMTIVHKNEIPGVSIHLVAETGRDLEAVEMMRAKAGIKMSGDLSILEPTDALTWEINLRLNEVENGKEQANDD